MAEDRHDHIGQDLMPSALILRLISGPSAADWQVTRLYPDMAQPPQLMLAPWERDPSFLQTLHRFWQLSRQVLTEASAVEMLHMHAAALGDQLAHVLTAQDRSYLTTPAADGAIPCLMIESADETFLSLPWELIRLQGRFAVREGLLDVLRCVLIDAPPASMGPAGPMTLLMTAAAPEPSTLLDEDEERYRLLRAVSAPITPMLNETGEFEELLASVSAAPPTFGIHFSGHADDGQLLFEDTSGQGRRLSVENLQHAMRTTAPERQPLFFFLALDHDAASSLSDGQAQDQPWLARFSTAAKLHQAGIPQVVAYDRTVRDHASPFVESAVLNAFYTTMACGHSTRDAVRAARRILTTPSDNPTRPSEVGAALEAAGGVQLYAWTHLHAYHRGAEYRLGAPMSTPATLSGGPGDGVRQTEPDTLEPPEVRKPLLGRRKALHGLRRMRQAQQDIAVVQGLAGVGKTAFCFEALQLYKRLGYAVLPLRCGDVEFDPQPLNTLLWQMYPSRLTVGRHAVANALCHFG